MKEDIFISIAAYRDAELVPTIRDCIEKAKKPNNLHFVVCWQYDESDSFNQDFLDGIKNKEFGKMTVIKVPCKESKGACWARSKIQDQYSKEKYILQLDSHHRFVENWDTSLIKELKTLQRRGYNKPILTAYLPSYEPDNDPDGRINLPWEEKFDRFLPQGPAMPQPETIDDHASLKGPVGARLYSAHFIFSIGDYYKDILYDPDFYFHGEEVSLIIRAYTHGYDIFHPHKVFAWHHYTREGSKKHWDDVSEWSESNDTSHARYRQLVGIEDSGIDLGVYGLGTERTLKDYIRYSGIDVTNKKVHIKTVNRERPPLVYESEDDYENGFCKKIKYCIDVHQDQLADDDYNVWVVAFKDSEGNDTYRLDCDKDEILQIKQSKPASSEFYNIWREYEDVEEPHSWLVWPHSESKGWLDPITGEMPK